MKKTLKSTLNFSLPSVLWTKSVAKFEVSFECFCLCYNCLITFVLLIVFFVYHVCSVNKDSQNDEPSNSQEAKMQNMKLQDIKMQDL